MAGAKKYISLNQAARDSGCYSQEYLSLRARQGKLKATKIGRNWVTTKEWLDEYLEGANNYKNNQKKDEKSRPSPDEAGYGPRSRVADRYLSRTLRICAISGRVAASKVRDLLPVRKLRFVTVAYVLVFLLLSAGVVFGYPYLEPALNSVKDFVRTSANELATDIWNGSREVSISIEQFVSDTSEGITKITDDISENVSDFGTAVFIKANLVKKGVQDLSPRAVSGIKNFGGGLKFGLAFLKEEINEDLILPFINFFSFFGDKSQPEMTFGEYIQNDIQNIKKLFKGIFQNIGYKIASSYQNVIGGLKGIGKGINKSLIQPTKNAIVSVPGKIGRAIAYPFIKSYQFVVRPWSERVVEEDILRQVLEKVPEISKEEIENLKAQIEKLKEEGVVAKEIVKEVTKITQVEPVKEITKEITKIDDEELKKLKSQIAGIQEWETDIKTLQVLTSKLQTHPPYTQVTTAPIYIGSQGIQIGGTAILASLGVSGSAGITNLGVGDSTSLGSDSSDKLTVQATSEFFSPVTIQNTFTVGDTTNYLTINSTGNLTTTGTLTAGGDVTVSGNLTVTGAQTYSGAAAFTASSTSAALSVNQTGGGDIVNFQNSGTTVFVISENGNVVLTGNITITGSATTTGSMYAETYYSSSTDSTVRKSGEEVFRASVSIYRYEMPSQTSTTTYFRVSKYFSENPLSSTPPALPGTTRVYRLIIKYSDDITTSSTSLWRIYRTTAATTSDTFTLAGLGESALTEGTPFITDVLTIPNTDWQVEVKLSSGSNQLRIFQIYLSAYDKIN